MRLIGEFGKFLTTAAGVLTVALAGGLTAAPASASTSSHAASYGNLGGVSVPAAARAVSTAHPNHVVGTGTAASCTSAAVITAVAEGGIIKFDCGARPVTITMTATAKVLRRTVIDGGGKVTLNGGGKVRILSMDTCPNRCWEQAGPQLIVENMRFVDGYAGEREPSDANTANTGGGAIYVQGGQLKVVNSDFVDDKCYAYGPDLGGGAIRAYGMDMHTPIYITDDTFKDNACANGAALSGLYANFDVINSVMTGNKAIGWGQNPAQAGTQGGGSGGAIYTDGDSYNLTIDGSRIENNSAREGGGAIFFVVDNGPGILRIEHSTLHNNPSGQFQNAPGIFDNVDVHDTQPVVVDSSIS